MKQPVQAHVFMSGRVQGVNLRYYTQREANSLGLTGWVRNLADGRVEAIIEGDKETVQRMVNWCHQGPATAQIDHVGVSYQPATGAFFSFEVRW